jgi:hypothetical protein
MFVTSCRQNKSNVAALATEKISTVYLAGGVNEMPYYIDYLRHGPMRRTQ